MKPIVFLDTETCGLKLDDPIWEIAAIRRDESGDEPHHTFVQHDERAAKQLPERFRADHDARYSATAARGGSALIDWLTELLSPNDEGKAVIVGSAPDFDMYRIELQFGMDQIWNHHLIDAPTLAMGEWFSRKKSRLQFPPSLDEAAKQYGIDPRSGRHTAMRDVEITRDIFDAATHGRYAPNGAAA